MNAQDIQDWLMAHYGAEKFAPGLERVRRYLGPLISEIQSYKPKIITIAGTNGKGETSMSLASMARSQGISFALWTSPHILRVNERFQSEEGEISSDLLIELLKKNETKRQQEQVGLSYYEALWACFLDWVVQRKPQLLILEVGLGGRFDAVNILDADVVALTSISRDHQEFLGTSYRAILGEKLGVLRSDRKLVSTLELKYLRDRIVHKDWIDLFETKSVSRAMSFSERNRRLAQASWRALGMPEASLPTEPFAGRGEVWQWQGHQFVFYGSHNPDGLRKLVQFLSVSSYNESKEFIHQIWASFSQRPVVDLIAMKNMLESLAMKRQARLFFTLFPHPKASSGEGWWQAGEGSSAQFIHEWTELFTTISKQSDQRILVTGSYYFVAHLQHHLLGLGASPLCGRTANATR